MPSPEAPGLVFDAVAEEYDRARRGYPPALVDAACRIGRLRPGSRVLEVGCGTGKLTTSLAERGFSVDAVDPGGAMLAVARRRLEGRSVRFLVGRFEDVELPARAYDAVFSATAFHWIDPDVGWEKAARLLRPGGVLALLTHVGPRDEHSDELEAAWREVLPESSWAVREADVVWAGAEERLGNVSELWGWLCQRDLGRPEAAELYDEVRLERVPVEGEETAEQLIAHVRTTSSYLGLDAARRASLEERLARIVADAGGRLRFTLLATLATARVRG